MSRLGRAIADPTRCRMLLAMVAGPVYPAQLAEELDLTRSNVSNHLTFLRGSGLVVATPQGRQVRYELASPHLAHALLELLQVVGESDPPDVCDAEVEPQVAVPADPADPTATPSAEPALTIPTTETIPAVTTEAAPAASAATAAGAGRRPTRSASGAPHGSHGSRAARSHDAVPTRAHHQPAHGPTSAEEAD